MQYNDIVEAIKKDRGFEPKQSDFCKILDIGRGTMSNRAKNNSKFSDVEIEKLESYYAFKFEADISTRYVDLDYYPNVFATCGNGTMVFDETREKMTVAKDMIKNYASSKKYTIINAVGTSMSPRIEEDDKLIIEQWNGEQIKDNTVYLFSYNQELFIKRLVKNIDQIVCISENPRFEDRVIKDLSNFVLLGEVIGLFRDRV